MRAIVLRAIEHNGAPLQADAPIARFGIEGGSVGRADNNTLVLPDPDRYVSRLHAEVSWHSNGFFILTRGANPIEVNGAQLAPGEETPLHSGDEIRIGGYGLRVEAATQPAAAAPAAPLASDDPLGLKAGGGAPPPAPEAFDPFAAAGFAAAKAAGPLDPFAPPAQMPPAAPPPPPAPAAAPAALLPDDFDPFAMPASGATGNERNPFATHLRPNEPHGGGAGAPSDGLFDFARGNPLGERPPDAARALDPLVALSGARPDAIPPAPIPDHSSELHSPFLPPDARFEDPFAPAAPPPPAPAPRFSWEEEPQAPASGGGSGVGGLPPPDEVLASPPVAGAPIQAAPSPVAPIPAESVTPVPPVPPLPAAPAPAAPATAAASPSPLAPANASGSDEALLAALIAGLGVPELRLKDGLTPQAMERIGALLREAVAGTLDLLRARADMKREVHAEVTMISSEDNNPIKFSPDVDSAIMQLMQPRLRGFMQPVDAMRDAYEDLRAHEVAMFAGTRAALESIIDRFDPKNLEARIEGRSFLGNVLPSSRKAKLWESFEAMYRDISREAEDDFEALFGRAFLRAYKAQLARLGGEDAAEAGGDGDR